MKGERYLNNGIGGKFRCRAITKSGSQCKWRGTSAIAAIMICGKHRHNLIKQKAPLHYVQLD